MLILKIEIINKRATNNAADNNYVVDVNGREEN